MKCGKCGVEVTEQDSFCSNCGSSLKETPEQQGDWKANFISWLIGAILWCVIMTFVMIFIGESLSTFISTASFGIVVVIILNILLKSGINGMVRVPLSVIAFVIAASLYGNMTEYALLSDSAVLAVVSLCWPVWVVSVIVWFCCAIIKNK